MRASAAFFSIAILVSLSACDNQSDLATAPSQAIDGFDASLVARAEDLSTPLESSDAEPVVEFSSERKPLLSFADMDAFNRMASAKERLSVQSGDPLEIPSSLRAFASLGLVAPAAELSLADEQGRVVVGDRLYSLTQRGGRAFSIVTNASTGEAIETIDLTAEAVRSEAHPPHTNVPPSDNIINPANENAYGFYPATGYVTVYSSATSNYYNVRLAYAHDAYQTWLGATRGNAQTEIQTYYNSTWIDTPTSYFPGAFVGARVVLLVSSCGYGDNTFLASSGGSKIYTIANRDRANNHYISYSEHFGGLGVDNKFYFGQHDLNGLDTTCDSYNPPSYVPPY